MSVGNAADNGPNTMNTRRYQRLARKRRAVVRGALHGFAFALALAAALPASAQEAEVETMAAAGAELPANVINMIIVKVNGEPILLSDLRTVEEERLLQLRTQFAEEEIVAQLPLIRMQLLEGMIDERIMLQRADKLGITIDANQVDRYILGLREQNGFATDEEFSAALATVGLTLDELREGARDSLRQQRLVFDEVQRQIFVSEREIRDYYDEHRDEFTAPEEVRLEQLVFLGGAELAEQAAAAAAELQGGADPVAVGDKYVNAQFVPDNGSFIAVGDLTEGLAEAVPTVPAGRFSEPTQTSFGYSVFRVVERTREDVATLDQARDDIRSRLTTEKSQTRMEEYLFNLRGQGHLEVFDQRFAGIRERWARPPDQTDSPSQP